MRGKMGPGIGPPQGTSMEQQSPPGRVGSTGSAAKSAQFPSLLCLAEFQGCSPGVCAAGGISVKEGTPSSACLWWRFIALGGVLLSLHLEMLGVGAGSSPVQRGAQKASQQAVNYFCPSFLLSDDTKLNQHAGSEGKAPPCLCLESCDQSAG